MRTCPLGHTCSECIWEVETQKVNEQTQEMRVTKSCAITEAVSAQVAIFQQTHSVGAVLESARNVMVEHKNKGERYIEQG